jgi:hypothetical protein
MSSTQYGSAAVLAVALGAISLATPATPRAGQVAPGAPAVAQEADQTNQDGISIAAGLFGYSGGAVRAKRARTQTSGTTLGESAGWVSIPNATLSYTVPSGKTDLFNVTFSAEGRMFNGGYDDYLRIRVLDSGAPMEPYDGGQAFFSQDTYATHTGNWVKKVSEGNHTLQVQVWIFDGAPAEVLTAWIDDWTFELVVYD